MQSTTNNTSMNNNQYANPNLTATTITPLEGNVASAGMVNNFNNPNVTGNWTEANVTTSTSTTSMQQSFVPTIMKEVITEAAVVRETIKPEERFNIQEDVERTIHQTEIKKVIQPIVEKEIASTQVHHNTLPMQHREFVNTTQKDLDLKLHSGMNEFQNTRVVAPTLNLGTSDRGAVVHEHYDKRIIEQVQPIIYKEIVQPHIIETIQPIEETIYSAPVLNSQVEVRAPIYSSTIMHSEMTHSYTDAPVFQQREEMSAIPPAAPYVHKKLHIPKSTNRSAPVAPVAPVAAVAPVSGPIITPVFTDPMYNIPIQNIAAPNYPVTRGVDHIPSSDPALVQGNAHVYPTTVNGVTHPTIGYNSNLTPNQNPLVNTLLGKGAPLATGSMIGKQSTTTRPTGL